MGVAAGPTAARPARVAVVLAFAAIYLVWGSTYLGIRYAVETLPPFLMAGTRFLVAGALMYGWARARGAGRPTSTNWRATLLIGALLLLGGNGGVTWAEQRVESVMAALLVATTPLWMVLFEWWSGAPRPRRRTWIGLGIGFLGMVSLVGPGELLGGEAPDGWGAAAVIFATLSWAFGSVISRRQALPASPQLATGMEMLCGGALLFALGIATGEAARFDPATVSTRSWLALAYLTVFGSLVAFSAYVWLLQHVEVAKVSTYAYVNPVVAVALGWAVGGETLTARVVIAATVIVAGVIFITAFRRPPSTDDPAVTLPALPTRR